MSIRVLITPLDWGLGHATRCIPVIRLLLKKGCTVLIGGSGEALALLKEEFPDLTALDLPPYNPVYPKKNNMAGKMVLQLPKFIKIIREEHAVVERLVLEHKIDLVISDNRYGCWSAGAYSVFITHQSNIMMPKRFGWLSKWVRRKNQSLVQKFNECWIPDFPGEDSLAGELIAFGKQNFHSNTAFIGPLSRFSRIERLPTKYDIVAICSGPEPQRDLLEKKLTACLSVSHQSFLLVKGVIKEGEDVVFRNGLIINYLTGTALQNVIVSAGMVIARSGFSTVMDLQAMGMKAVFIPTPGQTEQEYLAFRLKERGIAFYMDQDNFDLEKALSESKKYSGFVAGNNDFHLQHAVDNVLMKSNEKIL